MLQCTGYTCTLDGVPQRCTAGMITGSSGGKGLRELCQDPPDSILFMNGDIYIGIRTKTLYIPGWYRNVKTFNCAVKFGHIMMFLSPEWPFVELQFQTKIIPLCKRRKGGTGSEDSEGSRTDRVQISVFP